MDTEEITTKLRDIARGKVLIDADAIEPGMSITDDLGLDSLKAVDFIIQIEDDFGFEFEEEDLLKLETVKDLIELIGSSLT